MYESTVQSPNWQVQYLPQFHQWFTGKKPRIFREDFCGSGKISCEWVKQSPKNSAVGLDIDTKALAYAKSVNQETLKSDAKKRVKFVKQNVLTPTKQKFDFIGAYNFSFFIFHQRKEMLQYARAVHRSLKSKGTFFLELAGGKSFFEPTQELKSVVIPKIGRVQYVWQQGQWDPLTSLNHYAIHYQLPNGKKIHNAFTYHWRVWGISELREILQEAGFKKTIVLWEATDKKGKPTHEFLPHDDLSEEQAKSDFWVAYVVGVKD